MNQNKKYLHFMYNLFHINIKIYMNIHVDVVFLINVYLFVSFFTFYFETYMYFALQN